LAIGPYKHVTWAKVKSPFPPLLSWYQSVNFSSDKMSSSSTLPTFNTVNHIVHEKLNRDNFHLWKAQVWPAVRGAKLTEFLDGTKKVHEKKIVKEGRQDKRNCPKPKVCGLVNPGLAAPKLPQLHPIQGSLRVGHEL
jgi:hypothetical protein